MIFAAPKVVAFCREGTLFHTLAIRLVANFGYPGTGKGISFEVGNLVSFTDC